MDDRNKYKFLVNTFTNWDEPPRARHQVTYALSKKFQVVFISANRIGFPTLKKQQISDNLCVITPFFPLDSRIRVRIPLLNKIYQKWLYRLLYRTYCDYQVINFDFTALYLHGYFSNNIYYCNDDHISMSYKFNNRWIAEYHYKCEQTVIKHSNLCIATSKFLVEKIKSLNKNTFEIRLGAPNLEDIRINGNIVIKRSDMVQVGFVGFLNTVDSEILTTLVLKGDVFLTIIGPIDNKALSKIRNHKNLKVTGTLTDQSLYNEVSKFDVGLIPYNLNSEIDRTPNKLWLYLSLGKPVVISNIKGIRDWEFPDRYVYRAELNTEFYDLIKKAYKENNDELVSQRIEFARNNSWDKRMEEFIKLCHQTYNTRFS